MAAFPYPAILTKASWDKNKGLLAKAKPTGIGEALKAMENVYAAGHFENFDAEREGGIAQVDSALQRWPEEYGKHVKPLISSAKSVASLAAKAAVDLGKNPLTKGGAKAAQAVADAAKKLASDLEDFEGAYAKSLVAKRKEYMGNIRNMLAGSVKKTLAKIDGLLKDIPAFASNPTEENYWKYFKGDCNARGYTTGCKNFDQWISEFPEISEKAFKGKAMEVFCPGMADYGANWSPADFEKNVNRRINKTGDEAFAWHAKHLQSEIPNIKKFEGILANVLELMK